MALFRTKDRFDPAAFEGTTLPDNTRATQLIGGGAFSHVYRGKTESGNVVAIKVLTNSDAMARKRFDRETKVLQMLGDNSHVVRLLGRGETRERRPYMLLEYIHGYTLRSLLDSGYVLEARPAAVLALQLCEAFTDLHRLGVAHGDVCPSNVMITSDGRAAKLFDFGLARDAQGLVKLFEQEEMVDGSEFAEDLDTGVLMGTPAYMAPEQIEDALAPGHISRTDTHSDVYALGVMLYEMVGGRNPHPFEDGDRAKHQDVLDYCHARLDAKDAPFETLDIPVELWRIIEEATATKPKLRYGDARVMKQALEIYLGAEDPESLERASTTMKKIATMVEEEDHGPTVDLERTVHAPEADTTRPSRALQIALLIGSAIAGSAAALLLMRLL